MPLLFDLPKEENSIIKVLGVGGGGSNAVTHMFNQGIEGVDFAICNTDIQALDGSDVPYKIQLGKDLTEGRGAGSKPSVGKEACLETIEEIKKFLEKNTKMLFVTAGLGGGTGTGAAPIIAKAAKELDILTIGIVTLPFKFEGFKRAKYAHAGLKEMKRNVDSIIVISNDKLREIHGNLKMSEAFAQADNILTTAAKGIAEVITVSGVINVDFEDVNTVMRESGVSIMGTAEMEGEDRARRAIETALMSPLLEDNDVRGAENILLHITSGSSEVTMDEISEITNYVSEEAGLNANVIWGNSRNKDLGEKISVTVIATGFDDTESVLVGIDDTNTVELGIENDPGIDKERNHEKVSGANIDPFASATDTDDEMEVEFKESEKLRRKRQRDNMKKINPRTLEELEKVPAFKRRNMILENDGFSADESGINMNSQEKDNNENSFLHRHVD